MEEELLDNLNCVQVECKELSKQMRLLQDNINHTVLLVENHSCIPNDNGLVSAHTIQTMTRQDKSNNHTLHTNNSLNDSAMAINNNTATGNTSTITNNSSSNNNNAIGSGNGSRVSNGPKTRWKLVSRVDFVAEYTGQTAIKTRNLIESMFGGVIIVDEAYSLINGPNDSYGAEALHVINQYMTEKSKEVIFIFNTYKDRLEKTLFTVNPGLCRRFQWSITIDCYSALELAQIFVYQLNQWNSRNRDPWLLAEKQEKLHQFFEKHIADFPYYGGDVNKLIHNCHLLYDEVALADLLLGSGSLGKENKRITISLLQRALAELNHNRLHDSKHGDHYSMYL
jgi:hypothetical protein